MSYPIELVANHLSFKGEQRVYHYFSERLQRRFDLQIYVPIAQIKEKPCMVLYYLPSLDSDAELLASQSDYQRYANRYDMLVVIPDIFAAYEGDMAEKLRRYWAEREQIRQFLLEELPELMAENFRIYDVQALMGYDFGATLALNLALAYPQAFKSVSAFAPWLGFWGSDWGNAEIAALGIDASLDPAQAFLQGSAPEDCPPIWIDQGTADPLLGKQIQPERIQQLFGEHADSEQLWYRFHKRYDHSFYFVHSHIRQHFVFHAHGEDF